MITAKILNDMELYRHRVLEIYSLLAERSLFLFGPRQTGKSSYVQNQLSGIPALSYNLLDTRILLRFLARPSILREEIVAKDLRDCVVFIDEIQKCPPLLDEVHLLIEERNIRFLLTGSSARKLKAVGTNLLGGRARTRYLHPFVFPEVSGDPDFFNRALLSGFIPPHYLSNSPEEDLRSYVGTYLQEEIAAEGLARNLSAFSRFLETASTLNAKLINYTNVANDAQVPRPTVRLWFQILYDTMIAYELPSFTSTFKRKAISTAKFYFFDIGVTRMLRRLPPPLPESSDFGELFEQYIFLELKAYIDYFQPGSRITYWRSTSGYEVDFIINKDIAIEVKTAQLLQERHLTGLRALREENLIKRFICVCREDRPRWIDGILVLPWQEFLQRLWAKELF
jgi:predicted AAA+ superfamily ATPase